jgi:hypothetical protein
MSPRDVTQVVIGTGTLYIAPLATVFPVDPTVAPAVAWEDIGYSEEGWAFMVDRTFEDIPVAEEFDPVKVLMTARVLSLQGVAVQVTLEALQTAMAGGTITTIPGPPAYKKYVPPLPTDAPTEKAVLLRVDAPTGAGKKRDIQAPRALSVGALEIAHKKAPDKRALAMELRLIKPTAGDIFAVLDAT